MSTGASRDSSQTREFAAFATNAFVVATSFCFSFVSNATRWSFSPFILIYPVISYLAAPLLVFAATVINIFVMVPLSMAHHLLISLYPVYVFCGVACVTGIVVGMGGRGLSAILTRTLAASEQDGSTDIPAGGAERRNRRRRRRIKEEDE